MRCEPVEHVLEVVYRAEVKTEEAAVLARDPVALGASSVSPAICGMRWSWPGAGRMRTTAAIAYPSAVGAEVGVVAADRAGALEPLDTLGHGRRAVVGAYMATDVRLEADGLGVGLAFANAVVTGIGVGVASSVIPPTPSTSWPWRVSAAPPTRCW